MKIPSAAEFLETTGRTVSKNGGINRASNSSSNSVFRGSRALPDEEEKESKDDDGASLWGCLCAIAVLVAIFWFGGLWVGFAIIGGLCLIGCHCD
jgi:hypothetical protein